MVPLKPDLCLVDDQRIAWVGNARTKRLPFAAYTNANLTSCSRTQWHWTYQGER